MTGAREDLDYLTAGVHARRSRLAEAQRLEALCRLRSLEELARAVFGGGDAGSVAAFQRRVLRTWREELEGLAGRLGPRRARMIEALARWPQVEDLKLLVRGLAARLPLQELMGRLFRPIPDPALASAASLEELAALLPPLPDGVRAAGGGRPRRAAPEPFLLETSLDHGHLQGLLGAWAELESADREGIRALVHQEVDHFHLMLVARGRFLRGLRPELLRPWHLEGTRLTRAAFHAMLSDLDLARAAGRARRIALDELPAPGRLDAVTLDARAWSRFLRLAQGTFRDGAMGFPVLVAWAALRRVEAANLVTLSEGIRLGMAGDALCARMIPRSGAEAALA